TNGEHFSPLAWAAQCNHPRVIRLLLAAGAPVDSPHLFPSTQGNPLDDYTPLMFAAEAGAEDSVAELLRHHPNLNARYRAWKPNPDTGRHVGPRVSDFGNINHRIRRMLRRAEHGWIPPR